jgi:hypothetical protein
MTPGRYLRLRRRAAGLRLDELPIDGTAMLAIERDLRAPTNIEAWGLACAFPFSTVVLVSIGRGLIPGLCRVCGCSEFDPCVEDVAIGVAAPCAWVDEDLCSACVGAAPALREGLAA